MRKLKLVLIALFLFGSTYCQSLENLQKKFATKVCDCIGELDNYEQLKPKLNKCYDSTMNYIFNGATSEEIKFYTGSGNLKLISQNLEQNLNTYCPTVKRVSKEFILPSNKANPYPTNFSSHDLQKAKENLSAWDGRIIAFDAKIIEVASVGPNRPYLKVQLDTGEELWVGSMANSKYETVGNSVRLLGYFALTQLEGLHANLNKLGYHVLAFGIVDLKLMQIAYFSGSEVQIREWSNGKIPQVRK
ncbi:MAG: hypothetical protein V4714_03855 [Bacteroidota bacterium]